jgi:hypothetical protein
MIGRLYLSIHPHIFFFEISSKCDVLLGVKCKSCRADSLSARNEWPTMNPTHELVITSLSSENARQRLCKHISAATLMHITIDGLIEGFLLIPTRSHISTCIMETDNKQNWRSGMLKNAVLLAPKENKLWIVIDVIMYK